MQILAGSAALIEQNDVTILIINRTIFFNLESEGAKKIEILRKSSLKLFK